MFHSIRLSYINWTNCVNRVSYFWYSPMSTTFSYMWGSVMDWPGVVTARQFYAEANGPTEATNTTFSYMWGSVMDWLGVDLALGTILHQGNFTSYMWGSIMDWPGVDLAFGARQIVTPRQLLHRGNFTPRQFYFLSAKFVENGLLFNWPNLSWTWRTRLTRQIFLENLHPTLTCCVKDDLVLA